MAGIIYRSKEFWIWLLNTTENTGIFRYSSFFLKSYSSIDRALLSSLQLAYLLRNIRAILYSKELLFLVVVSWLSKIFLLFNFGILELSEMSSEILADMVSNYKNIYPKETRSCYSKESRGSLALYANSFAGLEGEVGNGLQSSFRKGGSYLLEEIKKSYALIGPCSACLWCNKLTASSIWIVMISFWFSAGSLFSCRNCWRSSLKLLSNNSNSYTK